MNFIKKNIILILILAIGIFLRIYRIDDNPSGFFCDEASIGYNAYSLITTGHDEWDQKWPIFFKSFGEYKSPIMTYSAIPFVAVLGLNEFSVRLTSVFWGVIGVYAIYFLGQTIYNKKIGLLSALFLSISPWHIHFSRVSLEGLTPYVCFTILGVAYWFIYLKKTNLKDGVIASIFLVLATYSYFPARIFIPLFGLIILVYSVRTILKQKKHLFILVLVTIILMIPLIYHTILGPGLSRWEMVKGDNNFQSIFSKYITYFSYDYLFSKGDIDFEGQFITRHSIRGLGQLYLFQLPLLIIGLINILKKIKKTKFSIIILSWLILYPIPDVFTAQTSPYATRSIIGVIPFQIISSLGLLFLVNFFQRHYLKITFFLFVTTITLISFRKYFLLSRQYPLYSSDFWGWQYGPRQTLSYFLKHQSSYQLLCLEGDFNGSEIFIKFYDPSDKCLGKCQICDHSRLNINQRQLFSLSQKSYDTLKYKVNFLVLDTIKYPNGKPAFYIGEFHDIKN